MPGKDHSPEQVLNKLRQVKVAVAGGKSVGHAVREIGVTDHTYYRWRREQGVQQPVDLVLIKNVVAGGRYRRR